MAKRPRRNHTPAFKAKVALKADARQIGAPMPSVISTIVVTVGQTIKADDMLLSIEAMKMETAIRAEGRGIVLEVLLRAGGQIDTKDLLITIG